MLALIISFFLLGALGDQPIKRDICVVGGGAAGMATAFFAADNGYSVAVLEKKDYVGGHCKTTHFPATSPGFPTSVDYGVQLFPDTVRARAFGLFPFNIDTVSIVRRFAGNASVVYNNFTIPSANPNFLADVNIPLSVQIPFPPPPPSPDFTAAFGRLFFTLSTLYPWVSSPGYPDPIPAELLVTMDVWMTTNNFTILQPLISALTDNLGPYDEILAVYVLGIISPVVLNFFNPTAPVLTAFHVDGGCTKIYDGITAYLGAENVFLNSDVQSVKRKTNGKVQIRATNTQTHQDIKFQCDDVVIAFPQTLENLDNWDLDTVEEKIFSQVDTRNYWWGTAAINGTQTSGGFSIKLRSLNPSDPFQTPPYPGLIQVMRPDVSIHPAAWYAASGVQELTTAQILVKIHNHFNTLSTPLHLIDSVTIEDFNFHQYQPFVTNVTALSTSPTLYTQIENLQGHRHTYHVGALTGYAGTYIVWENAFNLVQARFPA